MPDIEFEVTARAEADLGGSLVIGTATPGLAGLSVVDYLVSHTDADQVGHVRAHGLADVTPFTRGEPRHAVRLYTLPDRSVSVIVGEAFLPAAAGEPFVDAVVEWATGVGIWEVVVPYALPYPHDPSAHTVSHVGTPAFRERRLAGTEIDPLPGGFLDGMVGELMTAGLERDAPVGTLVTPVHPPGPDLDAAVRLLDALDAVFDLDVDPTELEARADERRRYYGELAQRVQRLDDRGPGGSSPDDRMFM
jgi:uncharacterized protein